MSGFLNATQGWQMLGRHDWRGCRPDFKPEQIFVDGLNAGAPATFETPWWPKGGGFIGDAGVDVATLEASWWGEYDPASGAASRYGFVGVTRDALGTAVPSCVVKLFRTSDDALIDTVTSNVTDGTFLLNTPYYPDAHYIVAHKTGSPDIDGASVNTLIGT